MELLLSPMMPAEESRRAKKIADEKPYTALQKVLKEMRLALRKSETSSVTTAWGVNWREELIARDLMQNFYDANHDCLTQVAVTVEGAEVTITAPTSYNLERLFYLGSEKGSDDVGQYG